MKPIRILASLALLGLLAMPRAASAGTCSFTPSGGTLANFGTYFALSGDVDRQGNLSFTCLPTGLELFVSYTLQISAGLSTNQLERRMYMGASSLRYNLFKDAARTQVFGDGNAGTGIVAATCATLCTVPVYGRLYGAQSGTAGGYSDSVTISINF
ncbi:MAG: spore coat U domain-containing protein [Pseudomonadota bacterium]